MKRKKIHSFWTGMRKPNEFRNMKIQTHTAHANGMKVFFSFFPSSST